MTNRKGRKHGRIHHDDTTKHYERQRKGLG